MRPLSCLAASALLLVAISYASPDAASSPGEAADPMWSCGDAPPEKWEVVNKCRAECRKTKDARRADCERTYEECKAACPSGEDRMACLKPCRDAIQACLAPLEADEAQCAKDCVTSNGCTP